MKANYARVIGIDVSIDFLQISDSMGKLCAAVDNRVSVIKSLVPKLLKNKGKTLVVCGEGKLHVRPERYRVRAERYRFTPKKLATCLTHLGQFMAY